MRSCPIGPEYQLLVDELGTKRNVDFAYDKWVDSGNIGIPTPYQARKLVNEATLTEKDELTNRSATSFKYKKAIEQKTQLEILHGKASSKPQKLALKKLWEATDKYALRLRVDLQNEAEGKPSQKTISVSTFMGGSDFKGDAALYEAYRQFGNFLHNLIEDGQVIANETNKELTKVVNKEFFTEQWEKFTKKNPIAINNLDVDQLYEEALHVVSRVNGYGFDGAMVIPEVTIMGTSNTGADVVGRLDLIIVDSTGTVHILDFKTKKMNNLFNQDGTADLTGAFINLGNYKYPLSKNKEGASKEYIDSRSAFDNWMVQLDLYENMLSQNGITTGEKSIVSFLYEVDEKGNYVGSVDFRFTDHDYYEQSLYRIPDNLGTHNSNIWYLNETTKTNHINRLKEATNNAMPSSKDGKKTEEKEGQKTAKYEVNPTEKNLQLLVDRMLSIVDNKISELYDARKGLDKENKKDLALLEIINTRLQSLQAFKQIAIKNKVSNADSIIRSANFYTAVETVAEDIKQLLDITNSSYKIFKDNGSNPKKAKRQVEEMYTAYSRAEDFRILVEEMEEIINEAADNPDSEITSDSEIRKKVGAIHADIQGMQSLYKKMATRVWLEIAKTPGKEVYGDVSKQLKELYEPKLADLYEQKKKLEAGLPIGIRSKIKQGIYNLYTKTFRKGLEEEAGEQLSPELKKLEDISLKIEKLEAILDGFDGSEEQLVTYLEGATNPNSHLYIGTDIFVADLIAKGRPGFANLIASASNSDIGIATPVIMMKNAEAQSSYNVLNDDRVLDVDRKKRQLLKKMSIEQLNSKISEWRDVVFYNKETGEYETKRVFNLVKPFSTEYENSLKKLELNRRNTTTAYKEAASNYQLKFEQYKNKELSKEEIDKEDSLLKEARDLKEKSHKEYLEFIVKNSNTPYTDRFYSLQSALPEDIANEINDLYFEQEKILYEVGGSFSNTLDLNDEEDFQNLKEINIKIKKLREKAKEQDPKYAEYIDEFNELYEFDTNEKYFEGKRKQAEIKYGGLDSDLYKEWEKENMIERANTAWYDELNRLYEEKQKLTDLLPTNEFQDELDALYEAKKKALAPFKRFGRIQPKYMTPDDISTVDAIMHRIDEIYKELSSRPKNKMDRTLGNALRKINLEIDNLVQEDLSPLYKEEFEDKYTDLENGWRLVTLYQSKRDDAETKVAAVPSDENVKALQEADAQLQDYTEQFFIKEEAFEQYYIKYHKNEYKSIKDGFDTRSTALPKQFNYERLPRASVADIYMEKVPDPKYYSVKRLRKENWYYDGEHLHSSEIEALKKDPTFNEQQLINDGRLLIKEGAYNKDFHKGPENILLPKGIQYDGNNKYSVKQGYDSDPHINSKFNDIKKDKEIGEFYNLLSDLFFGLQSGVEGKKIGYQIPGFASSLVEKFASSKSMSQTFKEEWDLFVDKNFKTVSKQDIAENIFGDLGAKLRHRFTNQLPENMQSQDAISSIMKYSVEAHFNIGMQQSAPMVNTYIKYLENQKEELERSSSTGKIKVKDPETGKERLVDISQRVASLQNTIDILAFERRKFLYGQSEDTTDRSVKKVIDGLFAYTSFIRIGFDVANQVKNNIAGNVQAFIAAGGLESNHYSRKDWLFGKQMIYKQGGFLHNFFKDYGKLSDLSVSTMLYRYYNPAQKDPLKYFNEIGGGAKRRIAGKATSIQEMGYLLQDKGESEIAVAVMYAVLNNYKVKVIDSVSEDGSYIYKKNEDGSDVTIPAHEAYISGPNGKLIKRSDVDFSNESENRLRNTIYSEMRRAQGNYAKADMTKFEEGVPGKIVFFYRKFLVPTFLNRFGWSRPNWESGEVAVGYWRATYDMFKYFGPKLALKELMLGSKTLNRFGGHGIDNIVKKPGKETMSVDLKDGEIKNEIYVRNAAQARRDMWVMALLSVFSMMALAYIRRKDDDDEPLGVLEGNAFRILWGVKGEALSMFPVGGGSDEYIRNFTTAVPMVREITKLKAMGGHIFNYGLAMAIGGGEEPDPDWDSEYYKEIYKDAFYTKKQGPYEAGTSKAYKDLIDLTGIRNFRDILSPEIRIDQLKKRQ